MNNCKNTLLATSAAFGLLISLGTTSFAQTNVEKPEIRRFDEIIVTARKRPEHVQETPLSITVFTDKSIIAAGIRDMADIAKFTSGFSLDEEFGRTNGVRPVVRGQATILGASGVSTFVDGILLNGSLLDYDLSDVARIEVVKGPQSALYGRNTYSGAINIITKSPSEDASGDIKLDAGSFGRFELGGTVRGPISDVVSASLHGRFYTRGGPFTNTFDGSKIGQQQSLAASLGLFYEPSDRFSARARLRLSKLSDDQMRLFSTDPSDNNLFPDEGGTYLGNGRYFGGEITNRPIAYDDVRLLDEKGYEDVESLQASLTMNYKLNDRLDVEFINGFNAENTDAKFDFDHTAESLVPFATYIDLGPAIPIGPPGNPSHFFDAYVIGNPADFASVLVGKSNDYSSEIRLRYAGGTVQGLLGGYYYQGFSRSQSVRQAPSGLPEMLAEGFAAQVARMNAECAARGADPLPCFSSPFFTSLINFGSELDQLQFSANRSIIKDKRRNFAVFGSFDFTVLDGLTLTAEARYKSEQITNNTVDRTAIYDNLGALVSLGEDPQTIRTATFNSFNPRFSAKYALTDTTNVYGIVARGDKPGGFNNANAVSLGFGDYGEESVWAIEGGIKNTFMDGQLLFNLAGFHNTISDYQLTQSLTLANNITTTVISNVGKVRVTGFEAEMIYRVPTIPGFVITANYALADSEILRGTDLNEGRNLDVADDGLLNCSLGLENPSLPCSSENTLFGSIVGRQLPRSPKNSFNAGMSYSRPLNDKLEVHFNANVSHESRKFVQVHNLAWVGANTLVNSSIGFSSDNLSLTVWGRNLTNEDAVVSAQRFADPNRSFQRVFLGNPRLPREYGVTLRKTF